MYDIDTVLVRVPALEAMEADVRNGHARLRTGFDDLTAELSGTLAEWGESTDSRAAYDGFKARVDRLFADMTEALAKMPPAIAAAASSAEHSERTNAARWAG